MITSIRYKTAENTSLVAVDDGIDVYVSGYPSDTIYDTQMEVFFDGGGTIDPYDVYYGMSLDEVKEIGYSAVDAEEADRIYEAQHNPAIGVSLSDSDTKRANNKRDNKAKKKVNEISDADDHLYDHIDELGDFGETLRDQMEACGDNACIQVIIDAIPTEAWPTWIPE